MEDAEIVALFWARDEAALEAAGDKYGAYCRAVARNILHSPEDEAECWNDALLHAWNSIPPQRPADLRAFLARLTRDVCLNRWRDGRCAKRGGGELPLAYEELSEAIPDGREIDEHLNAAALAGYLDEFLRGLPETERRVFLCRYWYLDPISEIAARFGFRPGTVKTMLWRTRARLRLFLNGKGVFDE